MLRRRNMLLMVWLVTALFAIGAIVGTCLAQKTSVPKPQDKVALGENEVRQLSLLMDTDKTGKITKQEGMRFMEAEFEKLDKNKSGELDAKEVAESILRVSPFAKGKRWPEEARFEGHFPESK